MKKYTLGLILTISLFTQIANATWQDKAHKVFSFLTGAQMAALHFEVLGYIMYKRNANHEVRMEELIKAITAGDIGLVAELNNAQDQLKATITQKEFLALSALVAGSIAAFIADSTYKTDSASLQARLAGLVMMTSILVASTIETFTDKPKECSEREESVRKIITQLFTIAPVCYFNFDFNAWRSLFAGQPPAAGVATDVANAIATNPL